MATISFNYSGVSSDLKPFVQQALNKVFTDPTIRSQIGNQAETLTIKFEHDLQGGARAIAANKGPNQTITFNLDKLGVSNGEAYFDVGFISVKPFVETAIHEAMHIVYPNLTGLEGFHGKEPSPNPVVRGKDAAGEYAFRLVTTSEILRITGRTSIEEQHALIKALEELNSNVTTKPDLSGVIWDAYTGGNIRPAITDKNSIYWGHLPDVARGQRYDLAPDSGDNWTKQEVFEDGSSTRTVFDTGTKPWSSESSAFDAYERLQSQRVDFDNGSQQNKKYDPNNTHPYDKLDFTKGADGKVTTAQVTLDPHVLAAGMSIGQIFGSAIGGALGGNSVVGSLTAGAIGGLIGQKFVQVLATAMTADLSRISLNDVFATEGISVANAGFGVISSFLTAELGHALHIDGFDGQLFNTAASGFTTSLLIQVKDEMVRGGLDFAGTIAAIDWTQAVSNAIDVAQINVGNLLGSYLGNELVPAQTREGAIGGQLFGAIGGFILPGGLGSLIGTIIGRLIGNQFGTIASPGAVDLLDQAGYFYGYREYQSSDGGSYGVSNPMAEAARDIINAYLHAVDGAALDHSKQATIGFIKNPDLLFISGVPGNTNRSFVKADDAVHFAALDVLQNTEVIGGNLLLKRAHQNSPSNTPESGPAGGGMPGQSQVSGADQLATMAGDLSVAQDYENYLNNREAINALIAAYPNSAFAAGWIATFARVNDLGLNHMNASDFLGGLVGYLDSVNKAGLGAAAANATVSRGVGNTVVVEIKIPNGAEVPGALSVFADHMTVASDASGQTLQFIVDSGFSASGTQYIGDGASGTAGHDILVGSAGNDVISAGSGWDFVDGGAGIDYIWAQDGNDILRGGRSYDFLYGGQGDDTYVFNRGDGADTVYDDLRITTPGYSHDEWRDEDGDGANEFHSDWVPETTAQTNAGADTLLFGPGIGRADIAVQRTGNDLIVGVKDPAHPGAPTDQITLTDWAIAFNRIETFRFADGSSLDLSGGDAALASFLVPFGAALSRSSVVEKSAIGTVVGTVSGFDLAGASLSYSLENDSGGRFAIDASTGVVTVAGAIDYDDGHSPQIAVLVSDGTHVAGQAFTINVIDLPNRAPVLSVPASTVTANANQSLQASGLFSAVDADNDALTYFFQDGTLAANSGRFVLNGTALAQGAAFSVSAAQLAQLTFAVGSIDDDLSMQLADSHDALSAAAGVHVHVNRAPVLSVPASTVTASANQSLQVSSLFSAADADGDALTYYFQDGTPAANSGRFVLNGTAMANGAGFNVSAAQLAQLTFAAGSIDDDLSMQLADSHDALSAGAGVHVHVNRAPVLSVPASTVTASANQSLQVSSLFSAADADGDALTYFFQDGTPAANSGRFVLNGTALAQGAGFNVGAAQLAQLSFVAGSIDDDLSMQLADYHGALSSAAGFHVHVNRAPVLTVPYNVSANANQSLQASSLFSASDADGDPLTYFFQDGTSAANSGRFVLNGTALAQGAAFNVSAAQLTQLSFVAGSIDDDLSMQLADSNGALSSAAGFHVHVNHAPVLTVADRAASAGASLQVSSLFGASDADGDALTYFFQDGTSAANSGRFVLNGTPYAQGAAFNVSAAQLAQLSFVAGSVDDNLSMQLADPHDALSAAAGFRILVGNHAPVLTVPPDVAASASQSLQVSSLFSAVDIDGDTMLYFFHDGSSAADSGRFVLNGTPYAQGAGFYVVGAAQLAQLTFLTGSAGDDLSMQLADSHDALSAAAGFHIHVNDGWHI